jgi:hypothetical protein
MSLKTKSSLLATTLLFLLSIYAYGNFANFRPKNLIPAKEVKGVKLEEEKRIKLPYPGKYKIIGRTQENGSEHITYKTTHTPEEVQVFYQNVMLSLDWNIGATGSRDIFTTTRYTSDKKIVDVTTSQQSNVEQEDEEVTIVSLLIKN